MSTFLDRLRFRRDHRWAPAHMSAYVDAELAPSGQARMRRHVGQCQLCRRLLADLLAILDGLHRLPAVAGGADSVQVAAAVRRRLREPPAPP
jgi:anti-sigma factor RsiW